MNNIKMTQLGARPFGAPTSNAGNQTEADECLSVISSSYQNLLISNGGAVVFENGAKYRPNEPNPRTKSDGFNSLEILYGIGTGKATIQDALSQYKGELPPSFVPIGEGPGGNLVCVNEFGAVLFWDHEIPCRTGGWKIAESLDSFIEILEPDETDLTHTTGIIKSKSFLDF